MKEQPVACEQTADSHHLDDAEAHRGSFMCEESTKRARGWIQGAGEVKFLWNVFGVFVGELSSHSACR